MWFKINCSACFNVTLIRSHHSFFHNLIRYVSVAQISLMNEFSAMPIYYGEFKYCILTILFALADKGFSSLHILYFGIAATPISSATNQWIWLEIPKNLCVKSSLAKCAEQMVELGVGSHFAHFSRTKSTNCLRLFLASVLSSPANGIKCKEIPCFVLETLE